MNKLKIKNDAMTHFLKIQKVLEIIIYKSFYITAGSVIPS